MIDSGLGEFSLAFDLDPGKGRFDDVEDPAIIDGFIPDVSSKNNEVRFGVGHSMTIAFTGSAVFDVDDIPDANSLPDIQVEEVI